MARKIGKYKVSKRDFFLDLQDTENNTPSSLTVDTNALKVTQGGGVHIGGTTDPGDNNLKVDGTIQGVAGDITATDGNFVITAADHGIIHTNSGTVTQSTDHTNGVTINATSGVITLAAVALASTTNVEFTVTNSTVQADSVILITVQDENTTNNVQLAAAVHTIANGSFKISLVNPHSAGGATGTEASKIHFLVINNS